MEDYILTYYQQIKDGRIIAGKWILLLYEYIIKGLEEGLFFYDIKKRIAKYGGSRSIRTMSRANGLQRR